MKQNKILHGEIVDQILYELWDLVACYWHIKNLTDALPNEQKEWLNREFLDNLIPDGKRIKGQGTFLNRSQSKLLSWRSSPLPPHNKRRSLLAKQKNERVERLCTAAGKSNTIITNHVFLRPLHTSETGKNQDSFFVRQHPPIKVQPSPPGKTHLSKKQISSLVKKMKVRNPPFMKVEPGAYRANPLTRPMNPTTFVGSTNPTDFVDEIVSQQTRKSPRFPTAVTTKMKARIDNRLTDALLDFGCTDIDTLKAHSNHPKRTGNIVATWLKKHRLFSIPNPFPNSTLPKNHKVIPLFQFKNSRPIKEVREIIKAFGEKKSPKKLTLWFASNNGWLPNQNRPADLMLTSPKEVLKAARLDAKGSAA